MYARIEAKDKIVDCIFLFLLCFIYYYLRGNMSIKCLMLSGEIRLICKDMHNITSTTGNSKEGCFDWFIIQANRISKKKPNQP